MEVHGLATEEDGARATFGDTDAGDIVFTNRYTSHLSKSLELGASFKDAMRD